MNKEHIINEIRRTAKANGGVALGRHRFEAKTGIKFHDWYGRFWPAGAMLFAKPVLSRIACPKRTTTRFLLRSSFYSPNA
jgi:hypothetical protein